MEDDWIPFADALAFRNSLPVLPSSKAASSPRFAELAQRAENTMWEKLPLRTIADLHKERAEFLEKQTHVNLDDAKTNIEEVYIEYLKYLQLYPHQKDPEYVKVFGLTRLLERRIEGGRRKSDPQQNLSAFGGAEFSPPHKSESTAWTTVLTGVLPYAFIAMVLAKIFA